MFSLWQIAVSTKMEINSWLEVMIELVSYGTPQLETPFILLKDIKTPYIAWLSMSLLVIRYAQALLIILPKYGVPLLENNYQLSLDIRVKSWPFLLILTVSLLEQDPWIVLRNFGTLRWEKYIQHWKVTKGSLCRYILTLMAIWFWQDLLIKLP